MQVCVCAYDFLQVCTCLIGQAIQGGEGQSKLGVQVLDKLLDLTNLTSLEEERWVSRPLTLTRTHKQIHLHNSVNNTHMHTPVGRLCQYTQLEHVVLGSGRAALRCSLVFHVQIKSKVCLWVDTFLLLYNRM